MHIGYDDNDMTQFMKIVKIIIIENNLASIKFMVEPMDSITFNDHFQCYEVSVPAPEKIAIYEHKDFTCHIPKHVCRPYGKRTGPRFICVRHDLGTND